MEYETMKLDDFEDYDIALVQIRADGSASVRINKLHSTGNQYEHKTASSALEDAAIRVADLTNDLRKVCVSLNDGAQWNPDDGSLLPPKPSSLIAKPIR